MRLPLSSLRRRIREELALGESRGLDLGDVVFSPRRRDGAPTDEDDTPEEEALFRAIRSWVQKGSENAPPGLADQIRDLLYSPRYSDFFFSPPPDTVIYRGLNDVRPEQLQRWLASSPDVWASMMGGSEDWHPCRITLTPGPRGMTSWSTDERVATEDFADTIGNRDERVSVVFSAVVGGARDALDLAALQRAVEDLSYSGIDEGEVIVLGPIVTTGVRMVHPEPGDDEPF